jgi:Domain of unknown function (DUF4232)
MYQRFVLLKSGAAVIFAGCLLLTRSSVASASAHSIRVETCSLHRLAITVPSGSAAGGSEGMLIAFRNTGGRTCELHGYPKVVATRHGASFSAVPSPSTYLGGLNPGVAPPPVSLKPEQNASVVVEAGDEPDPVSSPCVHQRYASVTVSLPDQHGSKKLSARLPNQATNLPSCSRVLVTPFQSGLKWFGN